MSPTKLSIQDEVDPLSCRLPLYVNAKDCALEWIEESARRATQSVKSALFLMFHATFYNQNGTNPMTSGAIGNYYNAKNLIHMIQMIGYDVLRPYVPLFDALASVASEYPNLMFEVVHSDAHKFLSTRLQPQIKNHRKILSHHNVMIRQVEGASRASTMYSRFSVDPIKFQPITRCLASRMEPDGVRIGTGWSQLDCLV